MRVRRNAATDKAQEAPASLISPNFGQLGESAFGSTRCGYTVAAMKGGSNDWSGGLVVSIIAFAVGAILDFAVTVNTEQHGFNVNKVGVILMIVGAIGAVISIIVMVAANTARRRTVVDDGHGNVVRRVDSTY